MHHIPSGEQMSIYDASMKYQAEGTPLVVLAGAEYGTGSSLDWAAKGTMLLGVKAVVAKSFERIHRSNLAGMGVLPLQFAAGEDAQTLGFTGKETFDVGNVADGLTPHKKITVTATAADGTHPAVRAAADDGVGRPSFDDSGRGPRERSRGPFIVRPARVTASGRAPAARAEMERPETPGRTREAAVHRTVPHGSRARGVSHGGARRGA